MKPFFYIIAIFFSLSLGAQNSTLLTGLPLGSPAVDYNTGAISASVNQPSNVFDGDYTTFYASYERSNTFVGLDLGSPYVITSVKIAPRQSWASRVQLAIIEGANSADFSDAIPLTIINNTPAENVMTEYFIQSNKPFRYVRYVSPNDVRCNVAELQFYGYVSSSSATSIIYPQLTNIPTVSIYTTGGIDITSKENYVTGIINIVSENGTIFFTDSLSIRGRGNASWDFPKKPYKIKLNNKAQLLGMRANAKDWTLLSNYSDKTLIRNLLAFEISERFNMPFSPQGRLVDVVLNGEYKGVYQLCDQIEVGKDRVNITKMSTTDINEPELSGGYFVELDAYAYTEDNWFTTSRSSIPVTIKYPKADDIVSAQNNYIVSALNNLESVVWSSYYTDSITGHRSVLDSETFLKFQLINELAGNTDTYWSVNLYKQRQDNHFYSGPVWDFDLGFENDNRTYPICNNSNFIYCTTGSYANGVLNLVNRVMSDPFMVQKRRDIWQYARLHQGLNKESLITLLDSLVLEIEESQQLNFKRWPILSSYVHMNPRIYYSYVGEINNVRSYINNRFQWMDNKLSFVESSTDIIEPDDYQIYSHDGILSVKGLTPGTKFQIIDLWGRILISETCNQNNWSVALPSQVYILKIETPSHGVSSHKVLL